MEEILPGGNQGESVRIGDTVHRRSGPWTPAVHALLAHLERVGFRAAPQPIGTDEQGRAVLSFIPGEVHPGWPDPLPNWMFTTPASSVSTGRPNVPTRAWTSSNSASITQRSQSAR